MQPASRVISTLSTAQLGRDGGGYAGPDIVGLITHHAAIEEETKGKTVLKSTNHG